MRTRQIASVALIVGLTIAGFFGARAIDQRDARRDSERRAEVAAAQIRGRIEQATALAESVRRFMTGVAGAGITSQEFERNASRWLSPAGFPAAAWVEQVPASRRAEYELRVGHGIVTRDRRGRIAPVGARSSYLPATLVSGIAPMAVPGIDLGGGPGVAAALARVTALVGARATPLATLRDGSKGLFLIMMAPRPSGGVVRPGFVVVFVSELSLRAATDTAALQLTVGGGSTGRQPHGATVHRSFAEAGQRFDVLVPQASIDGAAAVLPWSILAAGLILAALAGALEISAARRARAQDELDRIFTLSSDLITVADFDGHFTRVNPAAERILGYTEEELIARPYLDLVHPDDRQRSAAEAAAIGHGKTSKSFENRFVRKDGTYKVLEWTATPDVADRLMYGVARDVTERRHSEAELARLADEQAALRRIATLVASGVPAAEVFSAVAGEVGRLSGADVARLERYEADGTVTGVAGWSRTGDQELAVGTRFALEGVSIAALVREAAGPVRVDSFDEATGPIAEEARKLGIRSSVGCAVLVEGHPWGVIAASSKSEARFPEDTESQLAEFTHLVGTAIANSQAREDLAASRARIVEAADEERRRVVRDLHDGAQQRLVHSIITLKLARRALEPNADPASALVSEALAHATRANIELRDLAHGILPAVLTSSGLRAAVTELATRAPVPVEVAVSGERLPAPAEATAYFVLAEALTNVAKHASATRVTVRAQVEDGTLCLQVRDNGVGGARPDGNGLVGLADRLAVLDGRLRVESPTDGGTLVTAEIPLPR